MDSRRGAEEDMRGEKKWKNKAAERAGGGVEGGNGGERRYMMEKGEKR